ncbi:MAG: NAD-dependent epimerase/dehydratase family protein [Bacteroidetes bacterium]|nr:MAG: NAD-dependent epimerase/dehydratase family protein [Bacteroidota bacterium]
MPPQPQFPKAVSAVLFTGSGSIYEACRRHLPCRQLSLRRASDAAFRQALEGVEVVVHNAANLHCASVEQAVADNFLPTVRLVNLCLERPHPPRLLYLSSMSILADEGRYRAVEDMDPYAYSKYLGETYCLKSALPEVCCVRFSTLFYEDPRKDGLSRLAADAVQHRRITLLNGGEARRDFLPLDVAAAYLAQLVRRFPRRGALNLAAGQATSFREVSEWLRKRLPGLKVENRPAPNGKPVLHRFSPPPPEWVEPIAFSLEEAVARYLQTLQS